MGSWFSNPIKPIITQPNVLDRVNCAEHAWESEFGWENAVVYRALDTRPGICSICYSVSKHSDKVIYTFYDTFCDHNIVSVNIEFEAVRDGGDSHGGPYKFGLIKTKDFSEDFIQRRRREHGPELLSLSYVTGRRRNQVALLKRGEGSYEIVFDSKSPLVVLHKSVHIYCDPSTGLFTSTTPTGNRISHDNNSQNELPHDVLKAVYDIRRSFVMENATIDLFNDSIVPVLPSPPRLNRVNDNRMLPSLPRLNRINDTPRLPSLPLLNAGNYNGNVLWFERDGGISVENSGNYHGVLRWPTNPYR